MRILVVEDDKQLLSTYCKSIAMEGHQAIPATDGRVAMDVLESEPGSIDLILSDVCMANMDGMAMLREIRKLPGGGPAVAFMSGQIDPEKLQEALQLRAIDFLFKPVMHEDLKRVIERASMSLFDDGIAPQEWVGVVENLEMEFPATSGMIQHVISRVRTHLAPIEGRLNEDLDGLLIALSEALSNAIVHGAGGEDCEVFLAVKTEPDTITLTIADAGEGFDSEDLPDLDEISGDDLIDGGRGIMMIRMYCDQVFWNEEGNEITLVKHLAASMD